jgi:hypothetical protein
MYLQESLFGLYLWAKQDLFKRGNRQSENVAFLGKGILPKIPRSYWKCLLSNFHRKSHSSSGSEYSSNKASLEAIEESNQGQISKSPGMLLSPLREDLSHTSILYLLDNIKSY